MGTGAPAAPETVAATMPRTAEVGVRVAKQVAAQQDAGRQMRRFVQLEDMSGRKPGEVIVAMNEKGAGWQNNEATQAFVQDGLEYFTAVQKEAAKLMKAAEKSDTPLTAADAQIRAADNVLHARVARELRREAAKTNRVKKQATPGESPAASVEPSTPEVVEEGKGEDALAAMEIKETPEEAAARAEAEATKGETAEAALREKAAEEARLQATLDLVKTWEEEGRNPDSARAVLVSLAAEKAVGVAEEKSVKAVTAFNSADSEKEQDAARTKAEHAKTLRKKAQKALDTAMSQNEKNIMRNTSAPTEARLLAYDIKLAQGEQSRREAQDEYDQLAIELPKIAPEKAPAYADKMEKVKARIEVLAKGNEALQAEREQIGTSEERQINYLAAEAMALSRDLPLPGITEESSQEQVDAVRQRQQKEIYRDPLTFLQTQMANEANMQLILENSGIGPKEQQQILEIAKGIRDEKAVSRDNTIDGLETVGKQSILVLLLLAYTASATNKAKKNGQMM